MNNTGWDFGLGALWGIHMLAVIFSIVGIIFLVMWAVKALSKEQLKMWGIALVIIGIVLCLLTAAFLPFKTHRQFQYSPETGSPADAMEEMMEEMMDDDDDESGMNHMGMGMGMGMDDDDAMGMSMNDMSAMLQGKTGDAFDQAFIEGMIPHHQGAIDMARAALQSAKHDEIKRMAEAIITTQQQEINQMQQWLDDWGYTN